MLNTISWQDYAIALAAILALYYVVSISWLFANDIKQWLRRRTDNASPQSADEEDAMPGTPQLESHRGESLRAEDSHTRHDVAYEASMYFASVADLLEEVKILTEVVVDSKATPDQTIGLFKDLLRRYPQLAGTSYRDTLNISFHHSLSAIGMQYPTTIINTWWSSTASNS